MNEPILNHLAQDAAERRIAGRTASHELRNRLKTTIPTPKQIDAMVRELDKERRLLKILLSFSREIHNKR